MKGAYYNEHEPFAAAWLRELIKKNLIAPGDVDERDIQEVKGDDVRGYRQVHFFAGIGGWSYALRLAGWPDDRAVWTGSCPCQPFSSAGKRKGEADDRHLWPEMHRLIRECSPAICFGEQVASDDGCRWLSGVFADLEALEYRVAGADLCAAGEAAPHIRQRIYWLAHTRLFAAGSDGRHGLEDRPWHQAAVDATDRRIGRETDGLDDASRMGREAGGGVQGDQGGSRRGRRQSRRASQALGLGDTPSGGRPERGDAALSGSGRHALGASGTGLGGLEHANGEGRPRIALGQLGRSDAWREFAVVHCRDGKLRRIEPTTFPLADGVPNRVGALCGAGNAIVPQVAARFIEASVAAIQESLKP